MEEENTQDPRETLRLFCTEARVRAFCRRYTPGTEDNHDRAINETDLRQLFGAYPRPQGDPLIIYLDEFLHKSGFRLDIDPFSSEMCMFVRNNDNPEL